MRRRFSVIAAAAVITALASPGVSSADFSVNLDQKYNGGSGTLSSPGTVTVKDVTGGVEIKINNTSSYVLDKLVLNYGDGSTLASAISGLSFQMTASSVPVPGVTITKDANNVNGGGTPGNGSQYDIAIDFTPGNQLVVGGFATFMVTGTGVTAAMFDNTTSNPGTAGNYVMSAHMTGVTGGASFWAGSTGSNGSNEIPTPAPAGLILVAGAVPFFGLIRRRFRAAPTAA
jgi:hypothetical protein